MPPGRAQRELGAGALCVLIGLLFASGTAGAIGVSSSKCQPVGSETLARDAHARIYSLPTRGQVAARDPESVRVLGCLFGPGHSLPLGTTAFIGGREGQIDTEPIDVATPMVAYPTVFQGVDFNRVYVVVRSLRDGKEIGEFSAAKGRMVEQVSSVTDIEVANAGAVAWISSAHSLGSKGRAAEVVAAAPGGSPEILDEGTGIELESLQLRGGALTWTDEGTRRSAPMP